MFIIAGLLITVLNTIVITDAHFYGSDYIYHPELQGWLKTHNIPATWADALLRCQLEGATLASPLNEKFLAAMKNKYDYIHIGIHASITQGEFFTIEGIPLDRIPVKWAHSQIDNHNNNENCLNLAKDGTLVDFECNVVRPFICYREITDNTDCGTTDEKYSLSTKTESCYKFHPVGKTWYEAFRTCLSEGGYLAIINSEDEANFLKDLFNKYPTKNITSKWPDTAAIGYYDWNTKNYWKTILGETLQEAGFNQQINNIPKGHYCGAVLRNGVLGAISCDEAAPFICEKKPRDNIPYIKCKNLT